jgi:hypothetical protein
MLIRRKPRPSFVLRKGAYLTIACLVHFASHSQCHRLLVERNYWNFSTCTGWGSGRCRQLLSTTPISSKFQWGIVAHLTLEEDTFTSVRHSTFRVHWDLLYEQCKVYNGTSRCPDYRKSMAPKLTDDQRELIRHELDAWDTIRKKNSQSKKINKRPDKCRRKSIQKSRSPIPAFPSPTFATSPPPTLAWPVSDVESIGKASHQESDCEIIGTSPYFYCEACIEIMITGEMRRVGPSSSQTLPDCDSDCVEIIGMSPYLYCKACIEIIGL